MRRVAAAFVAILAVGVNGPTGSDEPVDTAATEADSAALASYSGEGNFVIDVPGSIAGAALLDVVGDGGPPRTITITGLAADFSDVDISIASDGGVGGRQLLRAGTMLRYLKVEATGAWEINLLPVSAAVPWDGSETLSVAHNDVVLYGGPQAFLDYVPTSPDLSVLFLEQYTADGAAYKGLIAAAFESERGTAPLPAGPLLLALTAAGQPWSLTTRPVS